MENELETSEYRPPLLRDLGEWNRTENLFREIFKDASLKDREFRKMKLSEYDRIFFRHNAGALTQDERALLRMLRFQRRKMEKALYPGLLRRLLHRGTALIRYSPAIKREAILSRRDDAFRYADTRIPFGRQQESNEEHYQPKHRVGFDMGTRQPQAQQKQERSV